MNSLAGRARNRNTDTRLGKKCFVDGVLFRPPIEEVKAYYSRKEVLDQMLAAMQHWHVRLEPGERLRHRWLGTDDRSELHRILMRSLNRMSKNRTLVKFPYLRIDARRFDPVDSWNPEHMWGRDFILEKDGPSWRECWDAMTPTIKILDHYNVHHWLKYTGHHSLHVVIPAENWPRRIGGLKIADYMHSFGWRLKAFFSRCCYQPIGDEGFGGGTAGTNMPYTLNEDTGLLNYPVMKEEIEDFSPEKASLRRAEIRGFWREFPVEREGSAMEMMNHVLEPFSQDRAQYAGVSTHLPVSLSDLLEQTESPSWRRRSEAVVRLPWYSDPEATDALIEALRDRSIQVRRAAVKSLVGVDDPRIVKALSSSLGVASNPKLSTWAREVLNYCADIKSLRRGYLDH